MPPEYIKAMEHDPTSALPALALTFVRTTVVCLVYRYTYRDHDYNPHFHVALIGTSLAVTMIMVILWNAMWLTLALVGTLAIVRFRARIREPRDVFYLFAGIGIGVLSATGSFLLPVLCTAIVCLALLGLHLWQYHDGADVPDYTLTFCVKSPKAAEAFALAAPRMFAQVVLRSMAQIAPDCFEYVYAVRPRTATVEDAVLGLRRTVEGVSRMSLIKPESLTDI